MYAESGQLATFGSRTIFRAFELPFLAPMALSAADQREPG